MGNLTTGGTGKTPHVDYLIQWLQNDYVLALLSRGYGRKTKGFREVTIDSSTQEVGDEPKQLKAKYPHISVFVGENRVQAIGNILCHTSNDLILLDDAFQHRRLVPTLSIVLVEYTQLQKPNFLLPVGSLREPFWNYKRGDILVVTKCPSTINYGLVKQKIKNKPVFFSSLQYGMYYSLLFPKQKKNLENIPITLVSGIANPTLLHNKVKEKNPNIISFNYPDHHSYSYQDLKKWKETKRTIVTTEKDAVKLNELKTEITDLDLDIYCLPISISIEKEKAFQNLILERLKLHHSLDL